MLKNLKKFLSSKSKYFFFAKNSSSGKKITKQPPNAAQDNCPSDMPKYQNYPTAMPKYQNYPMANNTRMCDLTHEKQYQTTNIPPVRHITPPFCGSPPPMERPGYEPSELTASQQQQEHYCHEPSDQVPSSPPVYETHQPVRYIERVPPPNIPQNCSNCTYVSEEVRLLQLRFEVMEKNNRDLSYQLAFARDELERLNKRLCPPQRQTELNEMEYRKSDSTQVVAPPAPPQRASPSTMAPINNVAPSPPPVGAPPPPPPPPPPSFSAGPNPPPLPSCTLSSPSVPSTPAQPDVRRALMDAIKEGHKLKSVPSDADQSMKTGSKLLVVDLRNDLMRQIRAGKKLKPVEKKANVGAPPPPPPSPPTSFSAGPTPPPGPSFVVSSPSVPSTPAQPDVHRALMDAIKEGHKLKSVPKTGSKLPVVDLRNDLMRQIRAGKKLKPVEKKANVVAVSDDVMEGMAGALARELKNRFRVIQSINDESDQDPDEDNNWD